MKMRIDVYSHSFKVSQFSRETKSLLVKFLIRFGQIGTIRTSRGKYTKGIVRMYCASNKRRTLFRIHLNAMDDFLEFLRFNGITKNQLKITTHGVPKGVPMDLEYIDKRTPRPYQESINQYLLAPGNTKLVTLDPGKGKTFICLNAMRTINKRTFFCIKSSYIDKWVKDIAVSYKFKRGEVLVIRGSKNLRRLLELGVTGELDAKIILCSNSTLREYYKLYEKYERNILNMGYATTPIKLWSDLDIGLRVVDESHETLHFNFRLDLYTNVNKTIALSGTMFSDDPFVTGIQELLFPLDTRSETIERDKYIAAECITYSIKNVKKRVKYMNYALASYSHVLFEQSILKNKELLNGYMELITDLVKDRFIKDYDAGQKMIVYCSTIEMCTHLTEFIKREVKDLEIGRYVGEDDYNVMLDLDLIVTTLKSLGTAIDIPDLRMILLTDSVRSRQLNIQVLGRIRPLKNWPDVTPSFMYLTCRDIAKQVTYSDEKKTMFSTYVLEHKTTHLNVVL